MNNDSTIIEGLSKKDSQVIEEVMDKYGTIICGLIGNILIANSCEEGIGECYNDTLLILWTKFDKFDINKGNFRNWVLSIAKYRALDYLRKMKRENEESTELMELTSEDDVSRIIIRKEKTEEIKKYILKLPDKYRNVIYLKYIEGFSVSHIAEVLNINENLVYMREYRGKKKLRGILEGNYDE